MISRGYRQTATYWGSPVPNGTGGYSFDVPTTFYVRWEDRVEEFSDDRGEVQVSRAVVYVSREVEIGGYLYLGMSVVTDPTTVDGAFQIRQTLSIPDLRNAEQERRAYL